MEFSAASHLPLGLKIILGAPIIAFGIWLSWWGYNAVDWRDDSLGGAMQCVGAMLIGWILATIGLLIVID